ncbi:UNKNOWN [Stylonychia lemnae]|uniref:Uncharacterized protein n=1 Tax=Stylonychia lemnae TaxID=5949 RepID=A0A078ATG4_STYLE|nr:UNKNOWN [Stylonychia lemnae]|eukprot:CDW84467.1 UNKNOWN [Stylonychia lemnae]
MKKILSIISIASLALVQHSNALYGKIQNISIIKLESNLIDCRKQLFKDYCWNANTFVPVQGVQSIQSSPSAGIDRYNPINVQQLRLQDELQLEKTGFKPQYIQKKIKTILSDEVDPLFKNSQQHSMGKVFMRGGPLNYVDMLELQVQKPQLLNYWKKNHQSMIQQSPLVYDPLFGTFSSYEDYNLKVQESENSHNKRFLYPLDYPF